LQAGEMLHIRFTDHGPGIPLEHQAMIFERFYRVPGEHTASTGTGLGLYICKQIIMAHHGKIWVESAPERGTTFHIELPLDASVRP
jgi:signal transduction histidine kinase